MADLTDEELSRVVESLGGSAVVAASKSETARMVAEIHRRRAEQASGRAHVERSHVATSITGMLPCPFCGRSDLLGVEPHPEKGFTVVRCRACGAIGCGGRSAPGERNAEREAIAHWNQRDDSAEQAARRETAGREHVERVVHDVVMSELNNPTPDDAYAHEEGDHAMATVIARRVADRLCVPSEPARTWRPGPPPGPGRFWVVWNAAKGSTRVQVLEIRPAYPYGFEPDLSNITWHMPIEAPIEAPPAAAGGGR